jgi:amino acid adenylation domain-containing protein
MPAAADIHQVYPLSPLQQGMLSHYSGRRTEGVDLVQIVMTLPEALPAAAFARSWQWAARRHAILRTSFHAGKAGQPPFQQVHDRVETDFTWHDWSEEPADVREHKWTQLLAADRARGLDPAALPLWRVTVVQSGPSAHRVIFTFHHLLFDARAVLVFLPELFDACAAYQAGREPAAAPVQPYRDYIDWLQTRDPAASAPYWREKLAGFRAPTPLPLANQPGPSLPAGPRLPRDVTLKLTATQTATLQDFARAHDLTMNTLVQGAWALLLSRCSGEDDVVFGAVRACRHGSVPGAENLVGPLINTVPLRVVIPPGVRVTDWLRTLRRTWVELRPHEHVSLAAIRPWSQLPAGTPLFETVVSYQEPGWDAVLASRGGPWASRSFEARNQLNHPLALDAAGGPELQLRISYDPARFTEAAIRRMLGHLATLLEGMAAHPDRCPANLPLLTGEDEALLRLWRTMPEEFDHSLCVHQQFAAQAAQNPGALAVADEHRQLTYAELDRRAGTLARQLQAQGVGPGVYAGICVEPGVDLVIAMLAVLQAGGAYVPMDPAYPADRLAFMVRDAGIRLLLTHRKLSALFPGISPRLILVEETVSPVLVETPAVPRPASLDDLAYLIYTSGSTGQPKGVPIRHRALANLVAWHQQAYAVTPADRATQLASPAFDACVWELWPYLAAGASIHIPDSEVRISPNRLVRWLAGRRITLSFLPTPLAEATMDETWPQEISLRAILTGGDRLRRWPGRRLPCPLVNHYGPTESTVVATWTTVPPESDGHAAPAIGRPIANTEAYVLDAHRQPVPIGVPGELYLGGTGLTDGYHGRPELTAEKFVPDPFSRAGDRLLYRTGDLVRWRDDGQLDYIGRLDQQVKIRGHRIEPGEIEAVLNAHPAVRESLVIAREDAAGQPQLAAYLLLRDGPAAASPAELAEALHRRLPAYMVPVSYVSLAAWPLTAHGKIDRAALPAMAHAPFGEHESIAPRPGVETAIAGVWREVLGCGDIGACDDFFSIGGHSLRAAQVVSRLNAALNLSLTVRHLFEHSTIAGLAAAIKQLNASELLAATPGPAELVTQS